MSYLSLPSHPLYMATFRCTLCVTFYTKAESTTIVSCCIFTLFVCLVVQWCLTLCNPTDCSLPGSSVHGILPWTRILEWVAVPSSRRSSPPWDETQVSHTAVGFFTIWATWEALLPYLDRKSFLLLQNKNNSEPRCCGCVFWYTNPHCYKTQYLRAPGKF